MFLSLSRHYLAMRIREIIREVRDGYVERKAGCERPQEELVCRVKGFRLTIILSYLISALQLIRQVQKWISGKWE